VKTQEKVSKGKSDFFISASGNPRGAIIDRPQGPNHFKTNITIYAKPGQMLEYDLDEKPPYFRCPYCTKQTPHSVTSCYTKQIKLHKKQQQQGSTGKLKNSSATYPKNDVSQPASGLADGK
jgi:hypothetical protein